MTGAEPTVDDGPLTKNEQGNWQDDRATSQAPRVVGSRLSAQPATRGEIGG